MSRSREASRRWDAAHMMVLGAKVRRERAAKLKEYAAAEGTTISAIFLEALRQLEERHQTAEPGGDL